MLNKIEKQTTIHLEDVKNLNIHAFAEAFIPKKKEKLPSVCEFLKLHNLKHYRYRASKDGNVVLSVVTEKGRNFHSKERNFQMAYIKLVRNFNA